MRWRPRPSPSAQPRRRTLRRAAPRAARSGTVAPAAVATAPVPDVQTAQLQGQLPEGARRHMAQRPAKDLARPAGSGAAINAVVLLFVLAVAVALVLAWQGVL